MSSARINRGGGNSAPSEGGAIQAHTSLNGVPNDPFNPFVIPDLSLDLLQYLNAAFPDQLKLVTQLGSVEAAKGARMVIDHLTEVFNDQQETPHVLRRQQIATPAADRAGSTAAASG